MGRKLPGHSSISLESAVQAFLLAREPDWRSPHTRQFYQSILKRLLWYAQKEGWPSRVGALTEAHVRQFRIYVRNEAPRWGLSGGGSESSRRRASPRTVYDYDGVLRTFFAWAGQEGLVRKSPMAGVKVVKPRPKVMQPYTKAEIKCMLQVSEEDYGRGLEVVGSRNQAIILFLYDTGCRLAETVAVRLGDIDGTRGWVTIRHRKGGKEGLVRLGLTARRSLERYLRHRPDTGHPELWLTEDGRPLQARGVQALIKRLKARAGIKSEGSVHRFRVSLGLDFLRLDGNPYHLQLLLSHESLEMTRHYVAALQVEEALRAHETASPGDHLGLESFSGERAEE